MEANTQLRQVDAFSVNEEVLVKICSSRQNRNTENSVYLGVTRYETHFHSDVSARREYAGNGVDEVK